MKFVIVILILLIAGVGAYLVFKPGSLPVNLPNLQNPTAQTNVLPKEIEVSLDSQNDSGQLGVATLQKVDGKLLVRVNLKGQPEEASQPAHIHSGSCPTPGDIKYPLNPVINGTSETILETIGDDLVDMKPLAINVHKSDAEMKVYVACGNVEF